MPTTSQRRANRIAHRLRERLGNPEHLRITRDLGHLVCNEPRSPAETVLKAAPLLGNVQVDDMVRDVHEHLELGTGELDLDAVPCATGWTCIRA